MLLTGCQEKVMRLSSPGVSSSDVVGAPLDGDEVFLIAADIPLSRLSAGYFSSWSMTVSSSSLLAREHYIFLAHILVAYILDLGTVVVTQTLFVGHLRLGLGDATVGRAG